MPFNILRNSVIRNDLSCRHDNNDGWAVVWDVNDDFKQYSDISGLTSSMVWDRSYVTVSTSGVCYTGPILDQAPINALVFSTVKIVMRIEPSPRTVVVPTSARIQFQTDDEPSYDVDRTVDFSIDVNDAYNEYTVDMSQKKEWTGNVTRLRVYPFVDGAPGYIIHLRSIKVQSSHQFSCDTAFNGTVCDKFSQYSHPCPFVGRGGSAKASIVSDGVSILAGVNDKLVVNINGYGEQGVTLSPTTGSLLKDISREIEEKISNIGIGGYAGCRVSSPFYQVEMVADDTRESSSTVVVSDTAAARTLGFYDSEGVYVGTNSTGEDAASRYEPAGTIQLSKSQIALLYRADQGPEQTGVSLDVGEYALRGGRSNFARGYKDIKIDFSGKTIIDYNNPIGGNGVITEVAYSGDGGLDTEFRIFRPKADGAIQCIFTTSMEISAGQIDKVFSKNVSVRVRKGDLLGVYDGKVDSGKVEETPNGSYFLYDGDLTQGMVMASPKSQGRGEAGLRLFAHGTDKQTAVVLNAEFEQQELVEEVIVVAEEVARVEELNLTRARAGGLNGGVYITAITGVDKFGAPAPGWTNVASLVDKVVDATPTSTDAHPSWLDTPFAPPDKFDQTEMSIILEFAKGVPVFFEINRVVIYFKDVANIKYFGLEYPWTTDDSDNNQYFGLVSDKYNEIYMEGKLLLPDDHPLYFNPVQPTITSFIDSYQVLEYRSLDFRFDPVDARAIKYNVKNYSRETDITKSSFSDYTIAPSPKIMEIEVYAQSSPQASIADNFNFESSVDNETYYVHTHVEIDGPTSARYLIGYPIQHLRIVVEPQGKLILKSLEVTTSQARTKVRNVGQPDGTVSLNLSSGDFTGSQPVVITNDTSSPYNYYINIASQRSTSDRCILWNKLSSQGAVDVSEVGPSAALYKREGYSPREYNYAYLAPAYILDPVWMLNRNTVAYVSYDGGSTWGPVGNTISDYNVDTYITSENPISGQFFVYILLDLGSVYALDTVQVFNPAGPYIDFDAPLYSNKDVSDPSLLDLINDFEGVKSDARWLRFRAFSDPVGAPSGLAVISYVQTTLNPLSGKNRGKLPWVPAPLLTNYIFGTDGSGCGEGWHCAEGGFNNWYAVDLQSSYRVTNLIAGPMVGNPYVTTDVDLISPGDAETLFDEGENFNEDVAFSDSNVSDPSKVYWRPLEDPAGVSSRWILVRMRGGIMDELAVHVEDNSQSDKNAFPESRWWSSNYGTPVKDKGEFADGANSISITYPDNIGPALEELLLTQSLGIDHELAKRDQLRLFIYVSDPLQLNTSYGSVTLGKNVNENNEGGNPLASVEFDEVNYFQWPMSQLPTLRAGWNEVYLPFTDNFRTGRPYFEEDNVSRLSASGAPGRSRIRWLKVSFAGKVANSEFDVKLSGIEIIRADFVPCKFGNGLYLSGNEHVKFPLHNVNVFEGTVEFFLNPDWSKDPGCHSCEDSRDHTIFRLFNNDDMVLGLFMTGKGLRVYLSDGTLTYFLTDNSNVSLVKGANNHIAVTWDLLGRKSPDAFRVYINNVLSSNLELEAVKASEFIPNPDAVLMFGGAAWGGVTDRRISSVEGAIENVKVFNYAKDDFTNSVSTQGLEVVKPSEELVEISLDGVSYYGNKDRGDGMPLLVRNVQAGSSFNVYIKRKDSVTAGVDDGQDKVSYIEVLRTLPA